MIRHLRFFLIIIAGILLISLGCKNNATGADGRSEPDPDKDGPVISFVNPSEGGVVSGTLDIAGVAEDASDLQKVEVRIDGDPNPWESSSSPVSITGHYWAFNIDTLVELTEDAHTVEARATDAEGNLGATATLNFTVDHEYPEIQIESPSHGDLIHGIIAISGTSSATGGIIISSVRVGPDGSGQYYAATGISSWTYSGFDTNGITDGSYIIRAKAEADNSNSSMAGIGVTVDNTDPIITITSHSDGQMVSGNISLAGTASDNVEVDKVMIMIDSNPEDLVSGTTSWSYPIDTTTLSEAAIDNPHSFTISVYDTAGNIKLQTVNLYVDQTPPSITINIPPSPAAGAYLKGSQTIEGTVTNMADTDDMEISFNGGSYGDVGTFGSGAWSHTFDTGVELPADGQLTVSLRATDITSTASDVVTITYYADNTAPTGAITYPEASAQVSGQVMITGTAIDALALAASNGVYIEIVDDDNSATVNESADITNSLSNGQWSYLWDTSTPAPGYIGWCTITVTLTDEAGNPPIVLTRSVEQSNTAPSLTVNVNDPEADGGSIVHGLLTISGTATDTEGDTPGVSKVEIWFDSALPPYDVADSYNPAVPAPTGTVNWYYSYNSDGGLPDGPHDIHVKVTDRDGGTSEVTMSITIDNTLPVVSIDYPTSANTGDTNFLYSDVSAYGTASDIHLTKVQIEVGSQGRIDATGTTSWSYDWDTFDYPGAEDNIDFIVYATDEAGNEGQEAVTVDVRPKITSLSVNTELIEQSITINGYNFKAGYTGFAIVFPADGSTVNAATYTVDGVNGEFIDVTIPSTASSGDIYVTGNSVSSNNVHLDVWEWKITPSGGTNNRPECQAMVVSGTSTYQVLYDGGNPKDVWFSKDSGTLSSVDTPMAKKAKVLDIAVDRTQVNVVSITDAKVIRFAQDADGDGAFETCGELGSPTNVAITMISIAVFPGPTVADNTIGITYQDSIFLDMKYIKSTDGGSTWGTPETIDSAGDVGEYSALAYDTDGTPCIIYYDTTNKQVKYAYYTGTFWQIDTIESTMFQGEFPAIAVDSGGGIHVCYYDGDAGDLKYAYASSRNSSFTTNTVESGGITGWYSNITLDADKRPHIAYINYNYTTIRYAYYNGSAWTVVNAPASVGVVPLKRLSIGVDSSGYRHIGYVDDKPDKIVCDLIYRLYRP